MDEELAKWSERHKELRLEMQKSSNRVVPSRFAKLKAEANAVSHRRRKRIQVLEAQKLEQLAKQVEQYKGGAKIFAAIKAPKSKKAYATNKVPHYHLQSRIRRVTLFTTKRKR